MKNTRNKKEVTIEDLAGMVKKGFDEIGSRINGMDNKMATKEDLLELGTQLNHRIDGLELRVASHASSWDREYSKLHEWVSELDKRVNTLEDQAVE